VQNPSRYSSHPAARLTAFLSDRKIDLQPLAGLPSIDGECHAFRIPWFGILLRR